MEKDGIYFQKLERALKKNLKKRKKFQKKYNNKKKKCQFYLING